VRRGSPAWTVRVVLAMTLLTCAAWLPSQPAAAADPESWVSISIESMSPALPGRDGTVRLAGTVRNTSTETLSDLQAVLWRSLDPIYDREGMDGALASAANDPLGARVQPGRLFENIPSDSDRTLQPGEATEFDLTADIEDFELPEDDAVYLIGVQVRGRVGASDNDEILGRGRIFMPLVDGAGAGSDTDPDTDPDTDSPTASPAADAPRLQMASVVLLASRPSLVRTGVFTDEHLVEELAPDGRLRTLLEAARQPTASFAVDPALIEELETMRGGYAVVNDSGETTPGTGQAAAERWLQDFARLLTSGDGFRVLFGSPDLAALVHDGQQAVIDASAAAGTAAASTKSLPLIVLPTGGRADAATVAAADSLRPRAILLSENSADGPGPLLAGPGTAPIVSYSASALAGGPGPAPVRTAVKMRQRALADSWVTARAGDDGEEPDASGASDDETVGAEVRLITTAAQASTLSPERIGWIEPVTLSKVLAGNPVEWDGQFAYGRRATDNELSPQLLEQVRRLGEQFGTWADLLVDGDRANAQARSTLPRAASGQWRNARRAFASYTDAVEQGLDQVLRDQVVLSVPARVLTTGRDARFPITVSNKLPASADDPQLNAIQVVVRFRSANSQRLTVSPVDLPPVAAGANRTENVQVRAETNGSVQVTAELFTRSGQPVGTPVPVLVNATQAGTTGWIIALVAGIVLVGTTALRIRQVAKERSGGDPDPEPVVVSRPAPEAVPTEPAEELATVPPASTDASATADQGGAALRQAQGSAREGPMDV
jgi:hypothetical protein